MEKLSTKQATQFKSLRTKLNNLLEEIENIAVQGRLIATQPDALYLFKGSLPFSCSEIVECLKYHNERKNDVALGETKLNGGKNMWQLKWDKELADLAFNHAKRCELKHNKIDRPRNVGENIALRASSLYKHDYLADFVGMIGQWYNEINNYNEKGSYNGSVGHFTQMAWGATKFVGCGLVKYEDREKYPRTPYCSMLVCNYRPAGNIISGDMYVKDDGPNKCDVGVPSRKFKGLCAHDAYHARTGDICLADSEYDSEDSEPLSCPQIVEVLKYHNIKRNDVALGNTKLSGAKNMWQLKWDMELADVAFNYAKKCIIIDDNKERPKNTGECISWVARSVDKQEFTEDSIKLMSGLWDEINNYDENGNHNGSVEHFKQMVWADSKFIGCGMVYYEDRTHYPEVPYCTILVCDYRPAGNVQDSDMYVKHSGPNNCDIGVPSQEFSGLCAHDADHAKKRTEDMCHGGAVSEGRILKESVVLILMNFVIAWYCTV